MTVSSTARLVCVTDAGLDEFKERCVFRPMLLLLCCFCENVKIYIKIR